MAMDGQLSSPSMSCVLECFLSSTKYDGVPMSRKVFALFVLLLLVSERSFASSAATKIIQNGERTMRGVSTQSIMEMKVVRDSFTRTLLLRTWTRGKGKALVEILGPKKEEGIASLRTGNQMWNYLPKSDQVIRIPTSMMLQSWMGSDFTNDDLVKASSLVRDYHHQVVKIQGKGRLKRAVIQCVPKKGAPVVWGKILHWARLRDSLPVKQEYYDENGRLSRTIWFTRFRKMDDRTVPTRITVKVAGAKKEKTVVEYKKILFDRVIASKTFNRHQLRQTLDQGMNIQQGWMTRRLRKPKRVPSQNRTSIYAAK